MYEICKKSPEGINSFFAVIIDRLYGLFIAVLITAE